MTTHPKQHQYLPSRSRLWRHCDPPAILQRLADRAGIEFNGARPWDIQIHDKSAYRQIIMHGSLGLGESYMDGLWDAAKLDETFTRILRADLDTQLPVVARLGSVVTFLGELLTNRQSRRRAFEVGKRHYDLGNELYAAMLDPGLNYSCAYYRDAQSLDEAQLAKLDLICRKLELAAGERLLDIGCGWGALAEHAARRYGVSVVGITVSAEQQLYAQKRCHGLAVEIHDKDYRDLDGKFDKIASIGMFEHVGAKNYQKFFAKAAQLLTDDGLFLLHTIGHYRSQRSVDRWINKYIFPNGILPSAAQITDAAENYFLIEDWQNFGLDYFRTLRAWWQNFDQAWPRLSARFDQRFYRMWKYYLHTSMGLFRSRQGQLWQIVLSKRARQTPYRSKH